MRASFLLAAIILSAPAWADGISAAPEAVEITLYRDRSESPVQFEGGSDTGGSTGLAMVTEIRSIEIPAGASSIKFRGVADAIVPQTAKIQGLPATVLESNFDYDLISPGTLLEKSVGRHVRVERTDKDTGKVTQQDAILRSGPQGVVLDMNGKIEALDCSGLQEKIIFDAVPEGLAEKPTLSMRVRATQPGKYQVRLSYLALGLDWYTSYVAKLHPDGRKLDLTAWITLVNHHSTSFVNAPTQVVAGNLSRVEDATRAAEIVIPEQQSLCWPVGSFAKPLPAPAQKSRMVPRAERMYASAAVLSEEIVVTGQRRAQMSELGDYKLYTLPEPTTVAAYQTKQVQMLEQNNVPVQRIYEHYVNVFEKVEESRGQHAQVLLRLENKARKGLGKPLPAGTYSVMEPDAQGNLVLAGEQQLMDIPVGLPVEIHLGRAMDVWVGSVVLENHRSEERAGHKERLDVEVKLGNDKPVAIQFELYQPDLGEDFKMISSSKRYVLKNGIPLWIFNLKPGAREVLRYQVERGI